MEHFYDVRVGEGGEDLQLFHEKALNLLVVVEVFDGDDLAGLEVFGAEDLAEVAAACLLQDLVFLHFFELYKFFK